MDANGIEGHGIALDGFNTNCEVYGNKIYSNEGEGIQVNFGESASVYYNVVYSNGAHGIGLLQPANLSTVYNNTIAKNATAGIFNRAGRLNTTIRDNILYDNGTWGINV